MDRQRTITYLEEFAPGQTVWYINPFLSELKVREGKIGDYSVTFTHSNRRVDVQYSLQYESYNINSGWIFGSREEAEDFLQRRNTPEAVKESAK